MCRGGCESKAKGCALSVCADATFQRRDWKISSRSTRHPSRLAVEKGAGLFSLRQPVCPPNDPVRA